MSAPKPITEHLADVLRERSARGLAKYGTTIDRGDLTRAEWLQHLLEELLDAAQYVEAAKRQAEAPKPMFAEAGRLMREMQPDLERNVAGMIQGHIERTDALLAAAPQPQPAHTAEAKPIGMVRTLEVLGEHRKVLRAILEPAPQPQAEPVAWRVLKFTGSWKSADERWEVYSPDGSGGAVNESDVLDESVRSLLDAMAAAPQPPPRSRRPARRPARRLARRMSASARGTWYSTRCSGFARTCLKTTRPLSRPFATKSKRWPPR